ncbi:DUF3160 domain-containing protein [Desulfobacter latus]|uniref:DUF3160 domain-containing protein n=1 Tax=Desulfobacter latus TaxID=2292 RepID=A0A850SQR1_9BACT|nr:DUF3160 domain-containing protein [Desulfobacter latus]NWH03519.1 DUF3160 domain-containing protein [Desulfobacter latus]
MKKTIISIWLILYIILAPFCSLNMVAGASEAKTYEMLNLNENAKRLLEKNSFVVVPTKAYKDMSEAYEVLRKNNFPIFLTTDSILHTMHLLFDYLLRTIEVDHLMSDLKQLTKSMIKASYDDYRTIKDGEVKKAIYANIAFFSVAAGLLNEKEAIPPDVNDIVDAEIKLIKKHEGFKNSPVFGCLEDYSQYAPRGHYTRSEDFRSYFKAMMWFGRMGFSLNPSESLEITEGLANQMTRQALLIVKALNDSSLEGMAALEVWERIYEPTTFFLGKTDDLNVYDYKDIALKIYGKIPGLKDLDDELKLDRFMSEARKLRRPKILSTFVLDIEDDKKGAEDVTLGFRFMGQRFTPDSYIFQNLVYPKVMLYTGNSRPFTWVMSRRGPIRGFPRGLDIMAVLGSVHAENIIKKEGDNEYKRYNEQLAKLKKEFEQKKEEWSSNLYWNWLYCLKPLLSPSAAPLPLFMRSKAWTGKALYTALSSWAELRHDTILYAKQSYTMAGTGLRPRPQLTHGYVEPYPEVYARVMRMIEQMRKGMVLRGLLNKRIEDKLIQYERLVGILETISKKELTGEALTENEYKTIWNIGPTLKSLTEFSHNIMPRIASDTDGNMAVIADVHTDPNSRQVLEEGVGFPFIIYVRVSIEGMEKILRGPVFSYYEFKKPMSDRLTDEQWKWMLKEGQEPHLPRWTSEFIGK